VPNDAPRSTHVSADAAVKGEEGKQALDKWLAWASRSQLPPFIELARRLRRHRAAIDVTLEEGLSNARTEPTNTQSGCSHASPTASGTQTP
jgi:transposase